MSATRCRVYSSEGERGSARAARAARAVSDRPACLLPACLRKGAAGSELNGGRAVACASPHSLGGEWGMGLRTARTALGPWLAITNSSAPVPLAHNAAGLGTLASGPPIHRRTVRPTCCLPPASVSVGSGLHSLSRSSALVPCPPFPLGASAPRRRGAVANSSLHALHNHNHSVTGSTAKRLAAGTSGPASPSRRGPRGENEGKQAPPGAAEQRSMLHSMRSSALQPMPASQPPASALGSGQRDRSSRHGVPT